MSKNRESEDIGWFTRGEVLKMRGINRDIKNIAIYVLKNWDTIKISSRATK